MTRDEIKAAIARSAVELEYDLGKRWEAVMDTARRMSQLGVCDLLCAINGDGSPVALIVTNNPPQILGTVPTDEQLAGMTFVDGTRVLDHLNRRPDA